MRLIKYSFESKLMFNKLKNDFFNKFDILVLFKFNNNLLINDLNNLKQIKKTKLKFFFPFCKKDLKNFKLYIKYNLNIFELINYSIIYKANIFLFKYKFKIIKFNELIFKYNLIYENFLNFFLIDIKKVYYIILIRQILFV